MNILKALWHAIRPTAFDRADAAITRAANCMAEAARENMKANFYTCMLLSVDPHKDWWLFAKLKQKQHDAQQDWHHNQVRASIANERAEKLIDQMEPKNESNDLDDGVVLRPFFRTRHDVQRPG